MLDEDVTSPFYGRIKSAEGTSSPKKSIFFGNLYSALNQPEFYVSKIRSGRAQDFGAFWADDNTTMLKRTVKAVNAWFAPIVEKNRDWWDLGAGPGGGISMNDSITALMMTFRSVLEELKKSGRNPYTMEDGQLVAAIKPYAGVVGEYLAGLEEDDRASYRALRGVQGRTTRMRRIQKALSEAFPDFQPTGLDKFMAEQSKETNARSHQLITDIERMLQTNVIELLKAEYGEERQDWWINGVPEKSRLQATALAEKDGYKRGASEYYLNLIDYQDIIKSPKNWKFLGSHFSIGSPNANKDERMKWLVTVNDLRKIVMHASSGQNVSVEQLDVLQSVHDELLKRFSEAEALID